MGKVKGEKNEEKKAQHVAGDDPHHALSHIAPHHFPYTQHMAGDAPHLDL